MPTILTHVPVVLAMLASLQQQQQQRYHVLRLLLVTLTTMPRHSTPIVLAMPASLSLLLLQLPRRSGYHVLRMLLVTTMIMPRITRHSMPMPAGRCCCCCRCRLPRPAAAAGHSNDDAQDDQAQHADGAGDACQPVIAVACAQGNKSCRHPAGERKSYSRADTEHDM